MNGFAVKFNIEFTMSSFSKRKEYPMKSIASRNRNMFKDIKNILLTIDAHFVSVCKTGWLIILKI